MRPLFLAALAVLGLSACSSDEPTGGPGVHPDIRGSFVGLYQQTGVQAGVPDDFQCDMRVEVLDQFESAFIADIYFLQGLDCGDERLWAEAASGTIDLDGNVVLAWDNSPSCNVFDGDKQFAGTLVGNVLSLTAAYECDSWVYEDTYTGNRN
jgi:hypothetical protein